VRRACARRVRRAHPDFRESITVEVPRAVPSPGDLAESISSDIAIDFVDVTTLVERMQSAFFQDPSGAFGKG
jgi:hypothetical protein